MQGMADVVRYVPGVGIAQGEGIATRRCSAATAPPSDFFVDGVRDDVQYFRDLYNVERVEALKGPNAMIFGRGGVGGVINRVTRQADWTPAREIDAAGRLLDERRVDGRPRPGARTPAWLRAHRRLRELGLVPRRRRPRALRREPDARVRARANTTLRAGYEYFHDDRTADRGIPSFQGRPVSPTRRRSSATPTSSFAHRRRSNVVSASSSTLRRRLTLRNRIRYGDYDKFYQNVFPGAVNAAGTR